MTDVLQEPAFEVPYAPGPVGKAWYRRPIVIVPLVMVVVAAVVVTVVLLVVNGPVRVRGTVLDSMTGGPVANARISDGDRTAGADSHGVFTLDKVAKNATVTISAANYRSTGVKATAVPTTVRLTPIPVHATVVSALTGDPLSATLAMSDGTRVAAEPNGAATAYRVGPGDRVAVNAEGYVTATVAVGDDRTPEWSPARTLWCSSR